jgi:UDP-N-acetylmuramate dehydrogenase
MKRSNYPLKNITTIGLGGTCKEFVCPSNMTELLNIMAIKKKLFIGNGSNICFITDFYDKTIVNLKRMSKLISHDNKYIYCSSNISCVKIARYLHNNRISGFEYLYGIPGTIGGALYMNAGAFDNEILSHVYRIKLIDLSGKVYYLKGKDLNYSYRMSNIDKNSIIISVELYNHVKLFDKNLLSNLDNKRKNSQPINQLSCGCIFKNPPGKFASELIEGAMLKGERVGGIYISRKHSNYFINDGSGTYTDFLNLLSLVKRKISSFYGIELKEEVILIK